MRKDHREKTELDNTIEKHNRKRTLINTLYLLIFLVFVGYTIWLLIYWRWGLILSAVLVLVALFGEKAQ